MAASLVSPVLVGHQAELQVLSDALARALAGEHLTAVADPEAEHPLEHVPRLIVSVMDVQRREAMIRAPGYSESVNRRDADAYWNAKALRERVSGHSRALPLGGVFGHPSFVLSGAGA